MVKYKMSRNLVAKTDCKESVEKDQVMNDGDDRENNSDTHCESNDDGEMIEAEREDGTIGKFSSPSALEGQGQKLRSRMRKRRRSVGTTGLTPSANSKRARRAIRSTTKKTRMVSSVAPANVVNKPSSAALSELTAIGSLSNAQSCVDEKAIETLCEAVRDTRNIPNSTLLAKSPASVPDPRRISYSVTRQRKSSSDDESLEVDVIVPDDLARVNGAPRANTVPFDVGKCPSREKAVMVDQFSPKTKETKKEKIKKTKFQDNWKGSSPKFALVLTLRRFAVFIILGYMSLQFSMPQMIQLSQYLVPLDGSMLSPLHTVTPSILSPKEKTIHPGKLQIWKKKSFHNFEKLNEAKADYTASIEALRNLCEEFLGFIEHTKPQIEAEQLKMGDRVKKLQIIEESLKVSDLKQYNEFDYKVDGKSNFARDSIVQIMDKILLRTSAIILWDVPQKLKTSCMLRPKKHDHNVDSSVVEDGDEEMEARISEQLLEEIESALKLRASITVENFVMGAVAEDRIREWVYLQITWAVDNDDDTVGILREIEEFTRRPFIPGSEKIQKLNGSNLLSRAIQNWLEVHRADKTGRYDHALLKNGAEIIYGGERGTSKSLIDELPILNKILQKSSLSFFGFGPDAALTETYSLNAQGQCWSFKDTPLREQLRERNLFEKDKSGLSDFKRGNFGTLTIRLPGPILVDSITLEYRPIYNMIDTKYEWESAVRFFRVVGFEDTLASTKSWNLGSFEYILSKNGDKNKHLQRYKVATTVFGKRIPPLRSISLAVDSNYGHDYACLYRFRVGGFEKWGKSG